MRAFIIAVSITAALAACTTTTPAERAAKEQREVEQMVEIYGPACTRLGFTADTDPWRSCIINLSRKDDAVYQHPYAFHGYYRRPYWGHPYWGYW